MSSRTKDSTKRSKSFDNDMKMEEAEHSSPSGGRRRYNRRASTGGSSLSKDDINSSLHSFSSSTYDYNDATAGNGGEDDQNAHYMKAFRRGSLSKTESEQKLRDSLHMVKDYKEGGERSEKLQMLKDRFGGNNKKLKNKTRPQRRPSISSSSMRRSSFSSAASYSESQGSAAFSDAPKSKSTDISSSGDFSLDFSEEIAPRSTTGELSFNMSTQTIPVNNILKKDEPRRTGIKTDQVVESLVWFSFHTPRAVLEDLIAHEIQLWRRDHSAENQPERLTKLKRRERGIDDDDDDGSLSSLSDDGGQAEVFDRNFSEAMLRFQGRKATENEHEMTEMPKAVERESALLFVDMSGFTKLSTMLDVESLSKVINSYFDMIVSEVIQHGGDVLKFAGDAFFAEWKVVKDDDDDEDKDSNPLADLNASLASINEFGWDDDEDVPKLATCVLSAAKCAASIVRKFSDYHVTAIASDEPTMLNVHCGLGVGRLVGLHVSDYKADQEEEGVELRREFLILGDPIDQVSEAADIATDGEVLASPAAMIQLAFVCDLPESALKGDEPICIASRNKDYLNLDTISPPLNGEEGLLAAVQPYESLRMHCKALNHTAVTRLHLQMALHVHPVIRGDELALSAAIQAGKISKPTEALEARHRAEAELRSVFTIFISCIISSRITGMKEVDQELYKTLSDVMHVTSRELDRYSGHLRQFIVDDKGVVLIATFGLRGSTFPNMVANNGLPAVFAIHRALKAELNVENRIGATFGKVYCGVVGGVRRHEFAVMGAPVNLAARLMSSKVNKGILVDESVQAQADARFAFRSLPPVKAKGYDKPVPILEPLHAVSTRKKKSTFPFIGRHDERNAIASISDKIIEAPLQSQSSMVFLMGESGMGKTALALSVMEDIKKRADGKTIAVARSTSTETEQRIPLSSYRKIFMSLIRELCESDGDTCDDGKSVASKEESKSSNGFSLRSMGSPKKSGARFRSASIRQFAEDMRMKKEEERPSLARSTHGLGIQDEDDSFDALGESLRAISADFASGKDFASPVARAPRPPALQKRETSKRFLPSSLALSQSLHGDSPRRAVSEPLGQSLHHTATAAAPSTPEDPKLWRRTSDTMLHHLPPGRSPGSIAPHSAVMRNSSIKMSRTSFVSRNARDDCSMASMDTSTNRNGAAMPYFEKLCWVCEELDYPYEFADIVGSQFLGLDGASPVTHVDGHVPTMDELGEFLALAFICISDYADLSVIFVDDFQWVDSFSWKIFRVLCKRGRKILLMCAMRSHDKQAMRRLSTAATQQSDLQSVEISLGPLDFSDIRSLMSSVLEHEKEAIPDSLCSDIFQRTGGLPVYVVQMLENIKRKRTVELDESGVLKWNAEGIKEKRAMASNKNGAVMEETFLNRFDSLDVRVRKVLQTCAVLGLSFALTDVIRVHPEMDETDIENALDSAVDEMVLMEQVETEDDEISLKTGSTGNEGESSTLARSHDMKERFFQFSHAMWRNNVLTTMLKERKIELHRLIAEAMEKDQVLILEQSDISRLLTLFDHWKSCGDFRKSAPLALAVGSRLEEWDLSAQSLELYEDALEMSFDSVRTIDEDGDEDEEWIQVSAQPVVLDLILRLHIRVGLCHQFLGDESESISFFEDAYSIIKGASKVPGMSRSLMMPIISTLTVLKLEREAYDSKTKQEQEKLVQTFVNEASVNGTPVHLGRAIAMEAKYYAKIGRLDEALDAVERLEFEYDIEKYSIDMVGEYGRDFARECLSESSQWLYLKEEHEQASERADMVINTHLPLLDPLDIDSIIHLVLPVMQVFMLLGRAHDADLLLKKYVINSYHDNSAQSQYWIPLFNPLAYLIEVILMDDEEQHDAQVLAEMETWVLNEENFDFDDLEIERKAHTYMGELCWRLADFKDDGDPMRDVLLNKAREILTPVARYPHPDIFLKQTALALLEAM